MIKCEKCSKMNEDDAKFCKYCGAELVVPENKNKDTKEEGSNLVRCEYCGLLQPALNFYCSSCGTALKEDIFCKFCGYPLEKSWEYCPNCGAKIKRKKKEIPHLLFEGGYKLEIPKNIPIDGIIIGRDRMPPSLNHEARLMVSREHFKIYVSEDKYMIVDIGSTNGTVVDGIKLEKNVPVRLENESQILIAGSILAIFKKGDES